MNKVQFIVILWLAIVNNSEGSPCSKETAVLVHRGQIYDFSVRILYRVTHHRPQFVYSPLSTWLQLVDLAESTAGVTRDEITKVTKHVKQLCFRKNLRNVLNEMDDKLKNTTKRRRFFIVDELFNIKRNIKHIIEKENAVTVMTLSFTEPNNSANVITNELSSYIEDADQFFDAVDFANNELLLINIAYFDNLWKYPFNPAQTKVREFYSEDGRKVGEVNMMNQIGSFNFVEMHSLNAKVLELPCLENDTVSMLVFLPIDSFVEEVFYKLRRIRLATIYKLFKNEGVKPVNVSLPRFEITSEIENLPEMIYDMGVKRVFDIDKADFSPISDYKMHASVMKQISRIQVTEKGVSAVILEASYDPRKVKEFNANRPFGFLITDKTTHLILYAGIYSVPSLY